MKNKISILLLSILALVGCKCKSNEETEPFQALSFPNVSIPTMLTDTDAKAKYYVDHFWDGFLEMSGQYPSDSLLVSGVKKEDVEQAFVNYVVAIDGLRPQISEASLASFWNKLVLAQQKDANSNVLETIIRLAEKYLYDPNSPFRDEDYYFFFANGASNYEGLSPDVRGRYKYEATKCSLNRTGTKAADFKFADKRGAIRNLYSVKANYTLLFFTNPGCLACMDIITVLKEDPQISLLISSGQLAVVNIYIDEDIDEWKKYMPIYPENWYNGFDPSGTIRHEGLYNVRAIPSLYLLDSDKIVIMKDAPENKIFNALTQL